MTEVEVENILWAKFWFSTHYISPSRLKIIIEEAAADIVELDSK